MKNYNIIDCLVAIQEELYNRLQEVTTHNYKEYLIYSPQGFEEPLPMVCIHLDTINTHNSRVLPNKQHFDFVSSTNSFHLSNKGREELACLGGDDRAGLWIALQLIDYMESTGNYKYRIGFFLDEEVGCIGSNQFAMDKLPIDTTCYIGLDRRSYKGRDEVATYGFDNEQLTIMFEELGYKQTVGSVTDASTIASFCDIACVNLSVGYDNEHTRDEILYCDPMYKTLQVLKDLPKLNTKFEYEPYNYDVEEYNYYECDDEYLDEYVSDLEHRCSIFEETLSSMGMDIDDVLEQGGYYAISTTKG